MLVGLTTIFFGEIRVRGERERCDDLADQRLDGRNLPLKASLYIGGGGPVGHLEPELRRSRALFFQELGTTRLA